MGAPRVFLGLRPEDRAAVNLARATTATKWDTMTTRKRQSFAFAIIATITASSFFLPSSINKSDPDSTVYFLKSMFVKDEQDRRTTCSTKTRTAEYAFLDQAYEELSSRQLRQIVKILKRYSLFNKADRNEIARIIVDQSALHGLDPLFVTAMIYTESTFRPESISNRGAMGLMQLKPFVAKTLAEELGLSFRDEDLLDPEYNITLGVYFLSKLQQLVEGYTDDPEVATIAAYVYGPSRVVSLLKAGEDVPQDHAEKVLGIYHRLQRTKVPRAI